MPSGEYYREHSKYSPTLEPLSLKGLAAALADPMRIETTTSAFELDVSRPAPTGGKRFSIHQDGLFKVE